MMNLLKMQSVIVIVLLSTLASSVAAGVAGDTTPHASGCDRWTIKELRLGQTLEDAQVAIPWLKKSAVETGPPKWFVLLKTEGGGSWWTWVTVSEVRQGGQATVESLAFWIFPGDSEPPPPEFANALAEKWGEPTRKQKLSTESLWSWRDDACGVEASVSFDQGHQLRIELDRIAKRGSKEEAKKLLE